MSFNETKTKINGTSEDLEKILQEHFLRQGKVVTSLKLKTDGSWAIKKDTENKILYPTLEVLFTKVKMQKRLFDTLHNYIKYECLKLRPQENKAWEKTYDYCKKTSPSILREIKEEQFLKYRNAGKKSWIELQAIIEENNL